MAAMTRAGSPASGPAPVQSSQPVIASRYGTRDRLILDHQGLVSSIARSVWRAIGASAPLGDLIGFGQIALVEAAERFRPEMGCEFSTFGYYRIRGAILDGLCKMSGLSRQAMQKVRFLRGLHEAHQQRVAEGALGDVSPEVAWGVIEGSLRDGVATFFLTEAAAVSTESEEPSAESEIIARERRQLVRQAIDHLPESEAALIRKVYFEGLSLSEVAEDIGCSRSWASRLHQRAIAVLRRMIDRYLHPVPAATVLR
jgi:RNA polymerase sigma factor for flagellar operon FliA